MALQPRPRSRSLRGRPIVVNGAFRPQRVTGQQRYAIEIADRLVRIGAKEVRPGGFWSGSPLRTWLWTLLVLPMRTWRCVLVSLTARAPVLHPRQVLAVHDLFLFTNPEWYSRYYVRSHVPLLQLQLRYAAAVVAVSQPVADQVATRPRSGPVIVAPNAPSELFLSVAGAEEVNPRAGLETGNFLLAIGSLDPRKNLARLAAAWSSVPADIRLSCPLAVVGGSAAIYAQDAIAWPSGTIVTGYVSDEELVALYRGARAVVFVSLAEGFGLPIVEAVAAGVERLVLSDIDVFRWIAGEGAFYVDPTSPPAIAEALIAAVRQDTWQAPDIDMARFAWGRSAAAVMKAAERVSLGRRALPF